MTFVFLEWWYLTYTGNWKFIYLLMHLSAHMARVFMLFISKSRVVPIKPTTILKLELCGAVMGARLYEKVLNSRRLKFSRVFCWTDSTIVLGWLQMLPSSFSHLYANALLKLLELEACPN